MGYHKDWGCKIVSALHSMDVFRLSYHMASMAFISRQGVFRSTTIVPLCSTFYVVTSLLCIQSLLQLKDCFIEAHTSLYFLFLCKHVNYVIWRMTQYVKEEKRLPKKINCLKGQGGEGRT